LKARFAVNGIHSSSSDGSVAEEAGELAAEVCDMVSGLAASERSVRESSGGALA
jgi:hypothetical protein